MKIASLGITAKKKVELEGEPSYTSIDHKWKGAIPNLNSRLTNINIKANWIKLPLKKRCLVKIYEENLPLLCLQLKSTLYFFPFYLI